MAENGVDIPAQPASRPNAPSSAGAVEPSESQALGGGSTKSRLLKRVGMAGFLFFLIKGIFWLVAGIAAVSAGGRLF